MHLPHNMGATQKPALRCVANAGVHHRPPSPGGIHKMARSASTSLYAFLVVAFLRVALCLVRAYARKKPRRSGAAVDKRPISA